jgi:hypothetical protein
MKHIFTLIILSILFTGCKESNEHSLQTNIIPQDYNYNSSLDFKVDHRTDLWHNTQSYITHDIIKTGGMTYITFNLDNDISIVNYTLDSLNKVVLERQLKESASNTTW